MQHKRFWPQLKKAFKKISWFDWLVSLTIALFSIWLMFSTFAYQAGELMIKTKLWSDFAAHLPLIRSFSFGKNFPPQYPQFASEPIRYHYLFYLLVGLLEKIGFNLAVALNGLSAIGMSLLLIMIYRYAKLLIGGYCPEKHSTDVGNQLTRTQQPFIKFEMIVRSLDYDNIKTTMRAMLEIKSLVETRDYN